MEIQMPASQKWAFLNHLFHEFLLRVHNNTCNDDYKATRGSKMNFIFTAGHTKGDFTL